MGNGWNLERLEGNFEIKRKEIEVVSDKFANKWKDNLEYLKNSKILREALDEYEKLAESYLEGGDEYYLYWLKLQLDESNPKLKAKYNKAEEFKKNIEDKIRFFILNVSKISKEKQKEFLESEELREYRHFLENLFLEGKYLLCEKEEKIMNLKSSGAYSFWVDMLSGFLSKEEGFVFDENLMEVKKSFSEIRSLTENKNKKVRDKAINVFNKIIEKYEDVAENELNAVLENKRVNDKLRGFERPDKSRHLEDDIETEIVDALIESVTERGFEISRKFYTLKASLLNLKKFTYSERNIEYGEISKEFDYENSQKLIAKIFSGLDKRFSEILSYFIEKDQIDVFAKKGKRDGAFCVDMLKNQPVFVMLNHTNRLKDVLTFAHEMGHAIHKEFMKEKNNSLNIGTPKSTAEVASTFMEDFILQELLKDVNEEEKLILMIQKLQDDVQTIMRQVACYKFEQELHKEFRKEGYLSKKHIGKLFTKNMKSYLGEIFKDGKDMKNGWIYWPHIRSYFYNYSYASGLLISKALQKMVKYNAENIEKVKEFFYSGTSDSPKNIFNKIDIDISNKEFWKRGLEEIEDLLNETEELAKKLGKI